MTQNTQYQAWHKTFREQQSFLKRTDLKAKETQVEFHIPNLLLRIAGPGFSGTKQFNRALSFFRL
jgi:hypothetical protein